MKDGIHPTYNPTVKVTCSCGHVFETGSTEKAIHVEVCSHCHPFYTGKQKLVDTAGRVDKFRQRQESAVKRKEASKQSKKSTPKKKKAASEVIRIS